MATTKTKQKDFTAFKLKKDEKLLLLFPKLDDHDVLLHIKEKASAVFGANNVLVVMGEAKVSKVSKAKKR